MKGLYAIIDPEHCLSRDPVWVAERVLSGGCALLQLRAKAMADGARLALARALRERCTAACVPFIVNDRPDLALLAQADGLHLGQDDLSVSDARTLLGKRSIGLSTHSLAQALGAERSGADMLGFGPVLETASKQNPSPTVGLEALREVCARVTLPVVAIGGIRLEHAAMLRASGASYAAVISAVCGAEDPERAARELHGALLGV